MAMGHQPFKYHAKLGLLAKLVEVTCFCSRDYYLGFVYSMSPVFMVCEPCSVDLFLNPDHFSYTQNGILHMLDRNKRIKPRPERFQNCKDVFDLILTCEERVYDQVVEDLNSREQETCQPVHVINVDIQDNHEEATLGAFLICELCQCIQHTEDMENEIDELLQEFEEKSGRTFLHTVCFY
ncbi:RNA polymerase II subunit A C-terminal domain phosphatase SSU72, partial [Ophiophagus hannah]